MVLTCTQCQSELTPDLMFCDVCGAAVARAFGLSEPKRLTPELAALLPPPIQPISKAEPVVEAITQAELDDLPENPNPKMPVADIIQSDEGEAEVILRSDGEDEDVDEEIFTPRTEAEKEWLKERAKGNAVGGGVRPVKPLPPLPPTITPREEAVSKAAYEMRADEIENESAHGEISAEQESEQGKLQPESGKKSKSIKPAKPFKDVSSEDEEDLGVQVIHPPRVVTYSPGAAVLSVLVATLLLFTVTAGLAWVVVHDSISKQTVRTMTKIAVNEADIAAIPIADALSAKSMPKIKVPESMDYAPGKPLYEVLHSSIHEYYTLTFNIDKEKIKELLEHPPLRNSLSEIVDAGVDHLQGRSSAFSLSDRIVSAIESNKADIESITSYKLVDSDLDDIRKSLYGSGVETFQRKQPVVAVRNAVMLVDRHSWLPAAIGGVMALLLFLLVLINRSRKAKTLVFAGVACLVAGCIVLAVRFIAVEQFFNWLLTDVKLAGSVMSAMQSAFAPSGMVMLITGAAAAAAGVVTILVGALLCRRSMG